MLSLRFVDGLIKTDLLLLCFTDQKYLEIWHDFVNVVVGVQLFNQLLPLVFVNTPMPDCAPRTGTMFIRLYQLTTSRWIPDLFHEQA